eukprot:COSAG06_NODE_7076_length_2644_cov_1.548527_2_plen_156_part_00
MNYACLRMNICLHLRLYISTCITSARYIMHVCILISVISVYIHMFVYKYLHIHIPVQTCVYERIIYIYVCNTVYKYLGIYACLYFNTVSISRYLNDIIICLCSDLHFKYPGYKYLSIYVYTYVHQHLSTFITNFGVDLYLQISVYTRISCANICI